MRPAVRVILFDVDDTLLDFNACSRHAVKEACRQTGIPWSDGLYETFCIMNTEFWRQIEAGKLTLDRLWQIRWNRIFARLGIDGDGQAFEAVFHQCLDTTHETVRGAREILQELSGPYRLYAASNGRQKQQENRLALAGLAPWLEGVFTSQAAGANKPSPVFFSYVMDRLHQTMPDLKPEEVLMVGDSRRADIEGAAGFGMQTMWFHDCEDLQEAVHDWFREPGCSK